MNAIIIENDKKLARFVSDGLTRAGHSVRRVRDGLEGEIMARSGNYALAIVGVFLPGQDGITLIEKIRFAKSTMALIALGPKDATNERVRCLKRGADDYLESPFELSELLARIETILRRTASVPSADKLENADVIIDVVGRTAYREGRRIDLSPREFALLELLMRRAGSPIDRTYILKRLWGYSYGVSTNLVQTLVCRLRNRIDQGFHGKVIHTVRGMGYVFRKSR